MADVPPRETSPSAKSEEKRMFSQTTLIYDIAVAVSFVLFDYYVSERFMILISMKLFTFMILSDKCSIVVVKVLNSLIRKSLSS